MKKEILLFLIFWIITALLYRNALGNQFIDDFLTGAVLFEEQGWKGFKNSYGFTSLYYGHNLLYMGFYQLASMNRWAWFLLFTGLHALNALLGFEFMTKIFERNHIATARIIALSGTLLFLTSPYQTENVIWGATMHYAFSMLFMWLGFFIYEKYLISQKSALLIILWLLFAYSLLTLEISLVFPGLYCIVFMFLWNRQSNKTELLTHVKNLAIPMAMIIVSYFIATKLLKGHFIGHYGSETHLTNLFSFQSLGTYLQYIAKLLGYVHFFPYKIRELIYETLKNQMVICIVMALLIAPGIIFLKKARTNITVAYGLLLLMLITLFPVSNMYFMYLNQVENDRLSYFASFFFYTLIALLLSLVSDRIMKWVVVSAICLNIYLLQDYIQRWAGASVIQEKAVKTFRWENADKIFVLNQPCYYRSVYVFRNNTRFIRSMKLFRKINLEGRLVEIAWANIQAPDNNVTVEQVGERDVKVTLNEWGRWFWYQNRGATDYETDTHSANFDEWNHSYVISFKKHLLPNEVIIYFTPDGWQTFEFKQQHALNFN
jgi:hypothetical protein